MGAKAPIGLETIETSEIIDNINRIENIESIESIESTETIDSRGGRFAPPAPHSKADFRTPNHKPPPKSRKRKAER